MSHNHVTSEAGLVFTAKLTNGLTGAEYAINSDADFKTALKVLASMLSPRADH